MRLGHGLLKTALTVHIEVAIVVAGNTSAPLRALRGQNLNTAELTHPIASSNRQEEVSDRRPSSLPQTRPRNTR